MLETSISKEKVNLLPLEEFSGEIIIVDSIGMFDAAIAALSLCPLVGLDTETRPSFKRGVIHKVSLMQVATADKVYLFRLNKIGFPDKLVQFLSDDKIIKIGLSLRDDFSGLNKQKIFKPAGFVDIQSVVKEYGIFELSLQKIYALLFEKKISKSQRLSNWENETLSEPQRRYAATDAWATLQIYLKLQTMKKLTRKELSQLESQLSNEVESK